jgi:hypothetical protein
VGLYGVLAYMVASGRTAFEIDFAILSLAGGVMFATAFAACWFQRGVRCWWIR